MFSNLSLIGIVSLSVPLQESRGAGISWLVWLIILIIAFIIMAMLGGRPKVESVEPAQPELKAQPVKMEEPIKPVESVAPVVAAAPAELKPDKLARIEGIGPKISGLLIEHGIKTFAQLSGTDVEHLQTIVRDAGIRIADPTTWPEQAQYAAAGDWEGLQKLQDSLKGGRRV
jgi:predicted flap endonuclease-1-like 5' DNA nuclease